MAVAVYFHPESLTLEQFDEINRQLEAAGSVGPPEGGLHLSCFGEDGHLMVYNVWESQQAFEEFGKILMPIIEGLGIKAEPAVMPVHRLDQSEVHLGMG
jgi:hypothetical protein